MYKKHALFFWTFGGLLICCKSTRLLHPRSSSLKQQRSRRNLGSSGNCNWCLVPCPYIFRLCSSSQRVLKSKLLNYWDKSAKIQNDLEVNPTWRESNSISPIYSNHKKGEGGLKVDPMHVPLHEGILCSLPPGTLHHFPDAFHIVGHLITPKSHIYAGFIHLVMHPMRLCGCGLIQSTTWWWCFRTVA